MDHALATLNSLADPERGETSKTRDTSIRAYITAIQGLPEESKALLVDDPGQAFEVRMVVSWLRQRTSANNYDEASTT